MDGKAGEAAVSWTTSSNWDKRFWPRDFYVKRPLETNMNDR